MKILEFKRSGIGIIAEFHIIPSRFHNQASKLCSTNKTAEYVMGLRGIHAADWVQEGAPYLADVTDGHPVSALGPRPSFQSGIHIISYFIEFTLSCL